jgi:hypothetical protein
VGTTIIRDEHNLAQILRHGVPRGLEVETFIRGAQYHVDGLVIEGELVFCWPSRYLGDCLSFAQGGISASWLLSPGNPLLDRLRGAAQEIIDILPTPPSTSFHLELFHTDQDELVFCEIASRTGGGLIARMIELAFGININKAFIQAQAGLHVDTSVLRDRARQPGRLLGWGFVPPQDGVFAGYTREAPDWPWVVEYTWNVQPGAHCSGPAMSVDHIAGFVVELDHEDQAAERITSVWRWASEHASWRIPP